MYFRIEQMYVITRFTPTDFGGRTAAKTAQALAAKASISTETGTSSGASGPPATLAARHSREKSLSASRRRLASAERCIE